MPAFSSKGGMACSTTTVSASSDCFLFCQLSPLTQMAPFLTSLKAEQFPPILCSYVYVFYTTARWNSSATFPPLTGCVTQALEVDVSKIHHTNLKLSAWVLAGFCHLEKPLPLITMPPLHSLQPQHFI